MRTYLIVLDSAERVRDTGVIGRNVYVPPGLPFAISGYGTTLKQQRANAQAYWNQPHMDGTHSSAMIP